MSSLKSTIDPVHLFEIFVEWIVNAIEESISLFFETLATMRKRWAAPFFRPDVLIAVDPLDPSCAILASGLAQACKLVAAEQRKLRIWIATVPGFSFEIRFHALKNRITVSAISDDPEQTEKLPPSSYSVPRLHGGDQPAILTLDAKGESLRLELKPTPRGVQWHIR